MHSLHGGPGVICHQSANVQTRLVTGSPHRASVVGNKAAGASNTCGLFFSESDSTQVTGGESIHLGRTRTVRLVAIPANQRRRCAFPAKTLARQLSDQ